MWGLALFGLVACAGFFARDLVGQVSAAPGLAPGTLAQTAPQSATASQVAQPSARTGVTPPPTSPGGPGWEWWKDDAVKKEVGLRPNQAADIDRIYQRRLREMDPVVQALVQERAVLTKMIAERLVDDTQFDLELTTRYYPLRSKLEASRILMLYRISKLLDADQFAKLRAISDRNEALQAGRRGRGGAPAPHPLGLLR